MKEEIPNFNFDSSKIPQLKIKSLHFENFKVFEKEKFVFEDKEGIRNFNCFYGGNGCGKTTLLDAIHLLFAKFHNRKDDEVKRILGRCVRNSDGKSNGVYTDGDFLLKAEISSSIGDYEVELNKRGFVKNHPLEISELVYRLFYYARFDQELNIFQLNREKWEMFKDFFETVTGFEISEIGSEFNFSEDPVQSEILKKYVLGFYVHKPDETITHRECSAGERKIIKSFSTVLNKEYMPSIICVDNVEMHVEIGRHLQLIDAVKKCFPESQIFSSTHSYYISRSFKDRNQTYDLRLLKAHQRIRDEKWRFYLADEIRDAMMKINSLNLAKEIFQREMRLGEELLKTCMNEKKSISKDDKIVQKIINFLKNIQEFSISDIVERN